MKTQASLLDLISLAMNTRTRPLDGVVNFQLGRTSLSKSQLDAGAMSARNRFPVSASIIRSKQWDFKIDAAEEITEQSMQSSELRQKAIVEFLEKGSQLKTRPSFRQLLLHSPEGTELITFADHAVADLLSVLNWTRHQLDVAAGRTSALSTPQRGDRPKLKSHENSRRKSRYAHRGASTLLWRRFNHSSRKRKFKSVEIDAEVFRDALSKHQGITYNDVLITILLESYYRWNHVHNASTERLSLWCPVNIRTAPFVGFGNGSSRIRIYPKLPFDAPLIERCQETRTQIRASKKDGEWFVPESSLLTKLPTALMYRAAKTYFNRPWVDMATAPFSHVENLGPAESHVLFPEVRRIEVLGELHHHYPLGISGVTMNDRTTLSCVYDPAMLEDSDVQEFMDLILSCLLQAQIEIQT